MQTKKSYSWLLVVSWLVGMFLVCCWYVGWLIRCLVGTPIRWLVGWRQIGWLIGRLVDWQVGRQVGKLVVVSRACAHFYFFYVKLVWGNVCGAGLYQNQSVLMRSLSNHIQDPQTQTQVLLSQLTVLNNTLTFKTR